MEDDTILPVSATAAERFRHYVTPELAVLLRVARRLTGAVLSGAAERLRERIAMQQHPPDARINETYLERARQRLTAEEFREAWSQGRRLSPQAALDQGLVHALPGGSNRSAHSSAGPAA